MAHPAGGSGTPGGGSCPVGGSGEKIAGISSLRSHTGRASTKAVSLTIACSKAGPCVGAAEIAASRSRRGRRAIRVVVGRGSNAIGAGITTHVEIPLTAAIRSLFRRRRVVVHAKLKLTPDGGQPKTRAIKLVKR